MYEYVLRKMKRLYKRNHIQEMNIGLVTHVNFDFTIRICKVSSHLELIVLVLVARPCYSSASLRSFGFFLGATYGLSLIHI